jgi:hypothetical protein
MRRQSNVRESVHMNEGGRRQSWALHLPWPQVLPASSPLTGRRPRDLGEKPAGKRILKSSRAYKVKESDVAGIGFHNKTTWPHQSSNQLSEVSM